MQAEHRTTRRWTIHHAGFKFGRWLDLGFFELRLETPTDIGTPVAPCGHGYGGMVIAGVANRLGERLDHLVFIDAYVPED